MASAIDASKPADGIVASKAELRANLATAKSEITALQAQIGTITPYIFNGQRNRIINGRMIIDTRNGGVAVAVPNTNTAKFGPDRWYGATVTGGGLYNLQTFASGGPAGIPSYMRVTVTTAKGTLVAGDVHAVSQGIEGYHWADMQYGSATALAVTLSFWVRGSIAGAYAVALTNALSANCYPASYTINTANTWEYKTITIPGPTTGTWSTTNTTAVGVRFDLGMGSTSQGTAGTWVAAAKLSYAGATSLINTNGATLDITGVQLEPGSAATPYDHRLAGIETALILRYYQANVTQPTRTDGYIISGTGISTPVFFSMPMRAVPTITTITGGTDTSVPAGNPTVLSPSPMGFYGYKVANATAGYIMSFTWTADAEIII